MPPMAMFLFACFCFISVVSCEEATSKFTNPPERSTLATNARNNPVWTIGSSVIIKWQSDGRTVDLVILQSPVNNPNTFDDGSRHNFSEGISGNIYDWKISLDLADKTTFQLTYNRIFSFELYSSGNRTSSPIATSEWFNLTYGAQTTTWPSSSVVQTMSSSSSSAVQTKSPSSSVVQTSPTTSTNTPTSSPSFTAPAAPSSSGGSKKLAIGLSIGLGIPILAILAGVYFMFKKRTNSNAIPGSIVPAEKTQSQPYELARQYAPSELSRDYAPSELSSDYAPSELSIDDRPNELPNDDRPSELPTYDDGRALSG